LHRAGDLVPRAELHCILLGDFGRTTSYPAKTTTGSRQAVVDCRTLTTGLGSAVAAAASHHVGARRCDTRESRIAHSCRDDEGRGARNERSRRGVAAAASRRCRHALHTRRRAPMRRLRHEPEL